MKRSYLMRELTNLFYNSKHIDVPSSTMFDDIKVAEEVIEFLEKIGMATLCDESCKRYYLKQKGYDSYSQFLMEANNGYLENSENWEPEDE